MKHVYSVIMVVIMLYCASSAIRAEEVKKTIKYNDYLKTVTDALPDFRKNGLAVDRARNSLDGAQSPGDFNLKASGTYKSSTDYTMKQYMGGDPQKVKDYSLSTGISKKITSTGTTIETGIEHDTIKNQSSGTWYQPSVYVKYSQSMLKNTFGVIDRYAVKNATMQLEIQKIKQAESDKVSLNYYRKLYFSWISTSERLDLLKDSIRFALTIQDVTEKKYRAGLGGVEDVYNAQALVAQYRINYQELASDLVGIEAEMKTFLDGTTYPEKAEFSLMYSEVTSAGYDAVPFSRTRSAEIYRLTKNNLVYAQEVKENNLLPELDLVAQYTRKSSEDKLGRSYGELNDSDYYIGFSASYPIGNTEAKSAVREAKIAVEEINTEYRISENTYRSNLEKLIMEKDGTSKIIELSQNRINSLEARYNTVYRKYKLGTYPLQQVIDALQDITSQKSVLLRYKNSLIQYYIDYRDLVE